MTRVIFRGDDLIVRSRGSSVGSDVIITFAPWNVSASRCALSDDAPGFADMVFEKEGKQVIYVIARQNHWYHTPETAAVLDQITAIVGGRKAICFGGSMGGSAAFHFAPRLGARYVAIAPQYSIDRGEAPFERRWSEEAAAIAFRPDLMARENRQHGVVLFDPGTKLDRAQAELIAASSDAILVPTPFGGHGTTRHVNSTYGLRRLVLEVLAGDFAPARFRAEIRVRRALDPTYTVHLVTHLLRRGNAGAARSILSRALDRGGLSFQDIHKLIRAFRRAGDGVIAEELFARLEAEPRTKPSDDVVFARAAAFMRGSEHARITAADLSSSRSD